MKKRKGKISRISLGKNYKRENGRIIRDIIVDEKKHKNMQKNEDTIERQAIHKEIIRLIGYGLSEQEVVERLREKFPESRYKKFFDNWVNDRYKKMTPMNPVKGEGLQR